MLVQGEPLLRVSGETVPVSRLWQVRHVLPFPPNVPFLEESLSLSRMGSLPRLAFVDVVLLRLRAPVLLNVPVQPARGLRVRTPPWP